MEQYAHTDCIIASNICFVPRCNVIYHYKPPTELAEHIDDIICYIMSCIQYELIEHMNTWKWLGQQMRPVLDNSVIYTDWMKRERMQNMEYDYNTIHIISDCGVT